jgi:hypothetical protein
MALTFDEYLTSVKPEVAEAVRKHFNPADWTLTFDQADDEYRGSNDPAWPAYCYVWRDSAVRFTVNGFGPSSAFAAMHGLPFPLSDAELNT